MDFFTYADDQIYESMIKHSKENPFKIIWGICMILIYYHQVKMSYILE